MRTRLPGRRPKGRRAQESGYVAVLMSIVMLLLFAMAAFAVDVGNWYLTGQRLQKAADAGALAGVPYLPATPSKAFTVAGDNVANNGFIAPGFAGPGELVNATLDTRLAGSPTRLRVTVGSKVSNAFGRLLGVSNTTIVRTSVADYSGPVPIGSPCNTFGNDPDTFNGSTGKQCKDVKGQFWASIGAKPSDKGSGDAYQNGYCDAADDLTPVDNCTAVGASGENTDYTEDGYFYSVTLHKPVNNLVLQAFDPAHVVVGDACDKGTLDGAAAARNPFVTDEPVRYATGRDGAYCNGDVRMGPIESTEQITTEFTVRQPKSTTNPWDPLTYPVLCGPTPYEGFEGFVGKPGATNLFGVLNAGSPTYDPYLARVFRRWETLCTIPYAPAGTYLIQVRTSLSGNATKPAALNRFSLRAYSSTDATAAESISVAGVSKMAMFSNRSSSLTEFYLARLPSGAAGQTFTVGFFDIGDSRNVVGVVRLKAPEDSGVTFTDCTGSRAGVVVTNCSFPVTFALFDGKWQTLELVVPPNYKCVDTDPNACWVTLEYDYGLGSAPNDNTSWTASLEGDPVRLVE